MIIRLHQKENLDYNISHKSSKKCTTIIINSRYKSFEFRSTLALKLMYIFKRFDAVQGFIQNSETHNLLCNYRIKIRNIIFYKV